MKISSHRNHNSKAQCLTAWFAVALTLNAALMPLATASDDIDQLKKSLAETREKEPKRHRELFEASVRHFYALENTDYHAIAQGAAGLVEELRESVQELETDWQLEHASQIPVQTELSRAYLYAERVQDLTESVQEIESGFLGRCDAGRLDQVRAHFDPLRHLTLEEVPDQTITNISIGISVGFNRAGEARAETQSSGAEEVQVGAAVVGAACLLLPPPASIGCYIGVQALAILVNLFKAVQRKQESAELLRKIYNAKIDAYWEAAAHAQEAIQPICKSTLQDTQAAIRQWSSGIQNDLAALRTQLQLKSQKLEILARALDVQVAQDLAQWCSLSWEQVGTQLALQDQSLSREEAQTVVQTLQQITQRFISPLVAEKSSAALPQKSEKLADDWMRFYDAHLEGEDIYPLHPVAGGAL